MLDGAEADLPLSPPDCFVGGGQQKPTIRFLRLSGGNATSYGPVSGET
jgi:hypothetical protein